MFKAQTKPSADNTTAITFKVSPRATKHTLTIVSTTGTVAAGTVSVTCDGAPVTTPTISLLSASVPAMYTFEAHGKNIVLTPSSLTADCTFTACLRSSN